MSKTLGKQYAADDRSTQTAVRSWARHYYNAEGERRTYVCGDAVLDVREDLLHAAFGSYDLAQALGLEKWQARPIAKHGVTLLGAGDEEGALAVAKVAVHLDPDCFEAQLLSGICWARKKDLARALSHYVKAQRLQPTCVQACVDAGEIRLGLGQYQEAAADFRRAFELDPNAQLPYTQRAMVLVAKTLKAVNN